MGAYNLPPDLITQLSELASRVAVLETMLGVNAGVLFIGNGSPNGVVTASPPAMYLNRAGGAATTLWIKESGIATNSGWVAK